MKKFLFLIILFLIIGCNENVKDVLDRKANDLITMGLKGKVKSYTEISYEAIDRFGIIEKGKKGRPFLEERPIVNSYVDYQLKFDKNGNQTKAHYYFELNAYFKFSLF